MGKCHRMAATFIDSFTGIPSHWLLETGCSAGWPEAHLGWDGLVLSCLALGCWGWEVVAGSRAGRHGVCLLGQALHLLRAVAPACCSGLGSSTDQVGWPGALCWLGHGSWQLIKTTHLE